MDTGETRELIAEQLRQARGLEPVSERESAAEQQHDTPR